MPEPRQCQSECSPFFRGDTGAHYQSHKLLKLNCLILFDTPIPLNRHIVGKSISISILSISEVINKVSTNQDLMKSFIYS